MALEDITDEYLTYESRLASFHKTSKKRGSTANGRGAKAPSWPHKNIAPASLAHAGLFYHPSNDNPDNVICFLCHKGLDGWEAGDDPIVEHLKHSSECGWAIVAAIEAEIGDYAKEDPGQTYMKEARKATFAGRWPHDGKKGWKCKTKQLVDAGWKYTPTSDSDDMATCVYCQLALDGWEPGDKPLDEHYNRSPDCAFFALLDESQATKKSRAKAGRASKASRLSVATVASEAPSITELTAGPEDSVLTTASTMTQGGKKGKGKKTATGKGRKAKAKKEEPVEIQEIEASVGEEESVPPPKPKRGKKRGSAAMEDSMMAAHEAPAPKKRATRTRGSVAVNSSTIEPEDSEMTDAPAPKKAPGRKKATAKSMRKTSTTSNTSTTSLRGPPGTFPDDDEIERQLEADLQRPLSEDEDITLDSDSERRKSKAKKSKGGKGPKNQDVSAHESPDYAMFNPEPADFDDADVEDELKALQAEMEMNEPAPVQEPEPEPQHEPEPEPKQELYVPKKGRKAGTRKASKQTKSKKTKAAPPPVEEEEVVAAEPEPELEPEIMALEPQMEDHLHDESMASTDTVVVKKPAAPRLSTGNRGRGRPSKTSLISQESSDVMDLVDSPAEPTVEAPAEPPAKRGRGRPSKASLASQVSEPEEPKAVEAPTKRGRGRPPKKSVEVQKSPEGEAEPAPAPAPVLVEEEEMKIYSAEASQDPETHAPVVLFEEARRSPAVQSFTSPQPPSSARHLANPPSTPGRIISPAPSARQAAISPSQSPQSSNAENEPPSSRPVPSTKRVALAHVAATPMRGSPSKRNVIAGLKSTAPWSAVDLDAIFGSPSTSPNKENGSERFLKQGQALTSPEKQMTVEEWINHNAAEAEKKLKHECEAMVSRFESEGTKAMRVLEGLVVE
ncbi:Fc.00g091560.m01.CDS01 [Cosmosporella sp. VM-42]